MVLFFNSSFYASILCYQVIGLSKDNILLLYDLKTKKQYV